MEVQLVTKARYAEMRGCAASAVSKAIAENRITTVMREGKELIDPAVADIQWSRNTRPRVDSTPSGAATSPPDAPAQPSGASQYEAARIRRETAEAELAELRLAETIGTLVRVSEVRAAMANKVAATREALMQIPARLVPVLAAETDQAKIHALLEAELHQALAFVAGEAA